MHISKRTIITAIAALCLCLSGYFGYEYYKSAKTTAKPPIKVKVTEIKPLGDFDHIYGYVENVTDKNMSEIMVEFVYIDKNKKILDSVMIPVQGPIRANSRKSFVGLIRKIPAESSRYGVRYAGFSY